MPEPIRILLLAADPMNRTRLRLGAELQRIQDEIRRGRFADRFELLHALSTRVEDMTRAIHDFRPHIIHFVGHGSVTGDLCFEGDSGEAHSVSPDDLDRFFALVTDEVDCVILNSCYSKQQSAVITQHIPYVVGMREVVTDEAAISFSVGFYQALAGGRSIDQAFQYGCVLVETGMGKDALQAELEAAPGAEKRLIGDYGGKDDAAKNEAPRLPQATSGVARPEPQSIVKNQTAEGDITNLEGGSTYIRTSEPLDRRRT